MKNQDIHVAGGWGVGGGGTLAKTWKGKAWFTTSTQAAALPCVKGLWYENHENYFYSKLRPDVSNTCVSDTGIQIESILAFEHCVKRVSHIFITL